RVGTLEPEGRRRHAAQDSAVVMRTLAVAAVLFFAAPAPAYASATLTMRDLPLHGGRALASTTPKFDLVGLHWRGQGAVQFRTRSLEGRWSRWHAAAPEAEDLPNAGSPETRASRGWRLGNPFWTGTSDRIEYRLRGGVERCRATFAEAQ